MFQIIKEKYPYFPIIGMIGFLVLFIIATTKYPGGSMNEIAAEGYSHFHNFICDLMSLNLEEGVVNDARPIAIFAHIMLSFAMISFFYILPELFSKQNWKTRIVRGLGMFAMVIFIFMYNVEYHDAVVTMSGILTIITFLVFFSELIHYEDRVHKTLAYICFGLSLIMFLSYETKIGIYYTPVFQKITFIFDAIWVIWVSLSVASRRQMRYRLS